MWVPPPPEPVCAYVFEVAVSKESAFENVFDYLIEVEGTRFVSHSGDLPSKFGITGQAYSVYLGRKVSVEVIKGLILAQARAFYKKQFWDLLGADRFNSQGVAMVIIDQAVHRGQFGGVLFLQRFLNRIKPGMVTESGIMTDETIRAVNKINEIDFIEAYFKAIQASYRAIAVSNPSKKKFLNGWLARSVTLLKHAYSDLVK